MTLIRVAPLATLLIFGFAGEAGAQFTVAPQPGQFGAPPPGQFGAPPGQFGAPPQQQGAPPCMAEFGPLRAEAEKRAGAIKTGAERKVPRPELCQLFRRFAEAEAKVIKYVTENQAACGIPPQAISAMKANHTQSMGMQQKICSADVGAEGRPRGSGLGEALGVRAVPTPETTTTGKGIFDTLSGSQLAQ
jgi:hypothetical protein